MKRLRSGFTLVEVLISVALLGIIVTALFSVVQTVNESNRQLHRYLLESKKLNAAIHMLYLDIASSDGNLSIEKEEDFSRLCIASTRNSLYGLSLAKVCWLVLKEGNVLLRIEGNDYHLPLRNEEKVEVDEVMRNLTLFDLYHEKDRVAVMIKQKGSKEPIVYMLQGILKPAPKKKTKTKARNIRNPETNATRSNKRTPRQNDKNITAPPGPKPPNLPL